MKREQSTRLMILAAAVTIGATAAYAKSPKRGIGWDEHAVGLNARHAEKLSGGVSWAYNWGPDAATAEAYGEEFHFAPMAWNGAFDESRIRAWVEAHPETRYLLGFNEPNFADQSRMTPAEAAEAWPQLKKIAEDYGLTLVAPALNFSNSVVGGRIWNPYEWYDEFFRLCPEPGIDCLAMHCYMNWQSANTWLATEYFYTDLYNPQKDCYGKYPNLKGWLDTYKEEQGHFPHMMLTEFCSWENDGTITGPDFQIDQMTQKVQMLELSGLVEGYAWFMANDGNGYTAYPYMSVFERNNAESELSTLGEIYVNMSEFDTGRYYGPGEEIDAKDYVNATTDERQVRLRPNSETGSAHPLQVEIPQAGYPEYQITAPADGDYTVSFHLKSEKETKLALYVDMKKLDTVELEGAGEWMDKTMTVNLTAGEHTLTPYNSGTNPVFLNSLRFAAASGVEDIASGDTERGVEMYDLNGMRVSNPTDGGLYVNRGTDGSFHKIIKM